MAGEDLGSAKLILTADDRDLSEKLRAAKQQVDELARQAGVTGDAFSKFFSRNFRLSINDSQLVAANTRLTNLQAKLKEIAASPINVRLNIIESGLGGGGKQITRETIQRQFQEAAKGGLSGQLADILAGGVGAARTADLRSTLLARLGRGSLGTGGFNVPGLREVVTQLGGTPVKGRAELLAQAKELVNSVNDAVIEKVGKDLLDLKLQLTAGIGGINPPLLPFGFRPSPGEPPPFPSVPRDFFTRQRRELDAAARAGGPRSPIRGGINFPGSPGFFAAALPPLPAGYFANQRRLQTAAAQRRQDIASNALIGGAFPLLFGQGIGASLGGGLGGAGGGAIGGQFGFGLSLLGTAVGAQFDALLEKGRTLAAALSDPIARFGELQQAGLLSSSALERSVQALIDIGSAATAAALIQKDLEAQYGASAVSAAKFFRAQAEVANRSDRQTDVTLGPFFDFLGAELQRAGRRITEPGFGLFPSAADRNRPDAEKRAANEVQNAQVRIQRIENQRLATQGKQLSSIAAQAQGYEGVAAALDNQVRAELNAADIADARRRKSEVQGDSPKAQAERAEIQREINRLIDEGTRGQQKYNEAQKAAATNSARQLALTKELVQVNPEERGFVQQRFDIRELQRQLAVTRAAAAANPADTGLSDNVTALENQLLQKQLTLQDQLLRFQRDRAATAKLQVANYQLEAQALDRQFNTAKKIAAVPIREGVSIARENAQFRAGLGEQVRQAQANEARIAAEIKAEQLRGGDGSAERIRQLQLDQVNAARETRNIIGDAANQLRDAGIQLAENLRNSIVNLAQVRQDPGGLRQFLSPQANAVRDQQTFRSLLPIFTQVRDRVARETGERIDFTGPAADVNERIIKFIQAAQADFTAQEQVIQTQTALAATNEALTTATAGLSTAINSLAQKSWNVAVNVSGASGAQVIGDVVGATA